MKPGPFEYHAPTSIESVLELLVEHGDEARLLAGGQSLVPLMALRMSRSDHVVDLNRVEGLSGVETVDGEVRIGAMTRQATIEHDAHLASQVPLLARATPHIGHFQIRNRGTIGGSLAHADPAAEYPAVLLALEGRLELRSKAAVRHVDAADFFEGMWTTSIEPDEMLAAVRLPSARSGEGFAVDEVTRRHGDFAMVGAAARIRVGSDQRVESAAVAMFGMGPTAVRIPEAEAALAGSGPDADLDEIGRLAVEDLDPSGDIHASAAYRQRVGAVSVRRALEAAVREARDG